MNSMRLGPPDKAQRMPTSAVLALVGFTALFYVVPLQALLRLRLQEAELWLPRLPLVGVPASSDTSFAVGFALALVIAYGLLFALSVVTVRILQSQSRVEVLSLLAEGCSIRDLSKIDSRLLIVLPLVAVGLFIIAPAYHTEAAAVLAAVAAFSFWVNWGTQPIRVEPPLEPRPPAPLPVDIPEPDETDEPPTTTGTDDTDGGSGDDDAQPVAPPNEISTVHRTYEWSLSPAAGRRHALETEQFSLDMRLSVERYESFRSLPRERNYSRSDTYVTAPCPEVEVLAGRLHALGMERGFRSYDQASNVLCFVQECIEYKRDRDESGAVMDYPKYPLETLFDEAGDCEDQSFLGAAVMKRMGFDVALLVFPEHVAIGVAGADALEGSFVQDQRTGIKYFYAESTGEGWILGELPSGYRKHIAEGKCEIVPIVLQVD